jgi:hypothetical protein
MRKVLRFITALYYKKLPDIIKIKFNEFSDQIHYIMVFHKVFDRCSSSSHHDTVKTHYTVTDIIFIQHVFSHQNILEVGDDMLDGIVVPIILVAR